MSDYNPKEKFHLKLSIYHCQFTLAMDSTFGGHWFQFSSSIVIKIITIKIAKILNPVNTCHVTIQFNERLHVSSKYEMVN